MTSLEIYFEFLFMVIYNIPQGQALSNHQEPFEVKYEWSYINFTWPSAEKYNSSYNNREYIPENNAISGIKFYQGYLYVALPRFKPGTPVTLAKMSTLTYPINKLFTPFPSWEMNEQDCSSFQNVQSMEIGPNRTMWVLDGTRINSVTSCPPKLVLLDLNNEGKVISSYIFPEEICLSKGGFLNDIVIDKSDGGYAYITDNSNIDPGLIVYSKSNNTAWKFRHDSMFPELCAANFDVNGTKAASFSSIDGVALSPVPKNKLKARTIYYCALNGYNLYSISTSIIKDKNTLSDGKWREQVNFVGTKESQSDGILIDSEGFMYFGLISKYSIGKWDTKKSFKTAKTIYHNRTDLIWPDSLAMDSDGVLYILASAIFEYFIPNYNLTLTEKSRIKIFGLYTGNKNYMN